MRIRRGFILFRGRTVLPGKDQDLIGFASVLILIKIYLGILRSLYHIGCRFVIHFGQLA